MTRQKMGIENFSEMSQLPLNSEQFLDAKERI